MARPSVRAPPLLRPRSRALAAGFLALGGATGALALYFYAVSLGLENPVTHPLPPGATNFFGYAQRYYQVRSDLWLCADLSAAALLASGISVALPSVWAFPALSPLRRALALLRGRSTRVRTAALAIPLALFETGLILYGTVKGLDGSSDLSIAARLDGSPLVRALVQGPLGPGGALGTSQDYYFLLLFAAVLAGCAYRFGSLTRVLQAGALSILPLPVMIRLFDPIEFNTFFASALDRVGLAWFTNALLLYAAAAVFVSATAYRATSGLAPSRRAGRERPVP
ncbi:MAG: hypothetical protein ABSF83_13855 [Nitrososphaerales archaeon]